MKILFLCIRLWAWLRASLFGFSFARAPKGAASVYLSGWIHLWKAQLVRRGAPRDVSAICASQSVLWVTACVSLPVCVLSVGLFRPTTWALRAALFEWAAHSHTHTPHEKYILSTLLRHSTKPCVWSPLLLFANTHWSGCARAIQKWRWHSTSAENKYNFRSLSMMRANMKIIWIGLCVDWPCAHFVKVMFCSAE